MNTKYINWKDLPEEVDEGDPYSWFLRAGGIDSTGSLRRKDQYSIVHHLDMISEEVYLLPDNLSRFIELAKSLGKHEIKEALRDLILH